MWFQRHIVKQFININGIRNIMWSAHTNTNQTKPQTKRTHLPYSRKDDGALYLHINGKHYIIINKSFVIGDGKPAKYKHRYINMFYSTKVTIMRNVKMALCLLYQLKTMRNINEQNNFS